MFLEVDPNGRSKDVSRTKTSRVLNEPSFSTARFDKMRDMIPVSFDPPLWEADHLKIEQVGRAYAVTWPNGNVTIRSRKSDEPDHRDLLRRNPSLRFHGMFGYSLGTYHEFFVGALDDYAEFKLGQVYVTFGEVTPLARFIFSADYHRKAHGDEWNYFSTVRLEGASPDIVEAVLLNALQIYDDASFDQQPTLLPFGPVEWSEPIEPKPLPELVRSIPIDIEPLRFFYHGRRESEHESACLQFYRVLEFYAFLELQSEVATLRADAAIDDRTFLKRVSNLVYRDERTLLVRLVKRIASKAVLRHAVKVGLIPAPDAEILANTLYNFRNSFVHAKGDQRARILAPSPLDVDENIHEWRHVLQALARSAIARVSRRAK